MLIIGGYLFFVLIPGRKSSHFWKLYATIPPYHCLFFTYQCSIIRERFILLSRKTRWSYNLSYLSSLQPGVAGPSSVSSPQPMKDSKEILSGQGMLDHIKPCWYWDKKDLAHTPSQSEGLDPGTEARYRREGARFIFDVGTRLGLYP